MKKYFAFAIAAATLAVGCQKNQDVITNDPADDGAPVPVTIGTNVATVSTKAAVEGTTFDANSTIFVYGIKDGVNELTTAGNVLLDGTPLILADDNKAEDGSGYVLANTFYGTKKETYSFYGYYTGTETAPENITKEGTTITIPIKIDGSQDIMFATTDKNTDWNENEDCAVTECYSAKSARKGVTPNLEFNHMLVRFDFIFEDGNEPDLTAESTESVWVADVKVESLLNGNLVINHGAEASNPVGKLTPTELAEGAEMTVATDYKDGNIVTFGGESHSTAKDEKSNAHATVMVMPKAEDADDVTYNVNLTIGQKKGETPTTAPVPVKLDPSGLTAGKFEAGKKYTVTVKVYGQEAVIVGVKLNEWTDGGSFTYDPDSDDNKWTDPTPQA